MADVMDIVAHTLQWLYEKSETRYNQMCDANASSITGVGKSGILPLSLIK
jgi:hypothetical protein